jgi:hypothetical protein
VEAGRLLGQHPIAAPVRSASKNNRSYGSDRYLGSITLTPSHWGGDRNMFASPRTRPRPGPRGPAARCRPWVRSRWHLDGEIHRVGPKLARWPSSLTENPYRSLRVDPDSGSTL